MTTEFDCVYESNNHSTTLTVITKMKPEPTKPAQLHTYYPTKIEAQQEACRTNKPWFTSYVNGDKKFSVRKATGG